MTHSKMHHLCLCIHRHTITLHHSKNPAPTLKCAIISWIQSSAMWCCVLSQLGINILEEPTNFSFHWKMTAAHSSEMPVPTYHLQWNHMLQTHNLDTTPNSTLISNYLIQWIISYMHCSLYIIFNVNNATRNNWEFNVHQQETKRDEHLMYINRKPKEMNI